MKTKQQMVEITLIGITMLIVIIGVGLIQRFVVPLFTIVIIGDVSLNMSLLIGIALNGAILLSTFIFMPYHMYKTIKSSDHAGEI